MAYLEKHSEIKNKWRIRWKDYQNGRRCSETFIGTKKEAEKELQFWTRREQEIKNGFIPKRVNMEVTLEVLKDWYFSRGLKWKNSLREEPLDKKTVYLHDKSLRQFAKAFGKNCLVNSISSTGYRDKNPNRKLNGLNVDIRAMITIINTALSHKDRLLTEMPRDLRQFSVKNGTPFYLEFEQVNNIMSSDMHNFYKDKPWDFDRDETMRIFTLYLHTGCRLNELLTLTWDNVHFEEKSITVIGKRKKVRKIFITETAMQILMSMTDRKQPMPYTEYKVRSRLNDLNKISGIKFTTHNLRSTCGSFMLSSGASIEEVSSHLGHEDIQTTWKWYARIIEEKRKSATLKMEKLTMGLPNYIVTLQDKTLA